MLTPSRGMALEELDAIAFSKKNTIRPFEDASLVEYWAQKTMHQSNANISVISPFLLDRSPLNVLTVP